VKPRGERRRRRRRRRRLAGACVFLGDPGPGSEGVGPSSPSPPTPTETERSRFALQLNLLFDRRICSAGWPPLSAGTVAGVRLVASPKPFPRHGDGDDDGIRGFLRCWSPSQRVPLEMSWTAGKEQAGNTRHSPRPPVFRLPSTPQLGGVIIEQDPPSTFQHSDRARGGTGTARRWCCKHTEKLLALEVHVR